MPDDVLVRAIVAHRRVLPDAYAGVGLTVREEGAMKDALLCAYGSLIEQLEAVTHERDALQSAAIRLCNVHRWSYGGPETLRALADRIAESYP